MRQFLSSPTDVHSFLYWDHFLFYRLSLASFSRSQHPYSLVTEFKPLKWTSFLLSKLLQILLCPEIFLAIPFISLLLKPKVLIVFACISLLLLHCVQWFRDRKNKYLIYIYIHFHFIFYSDSVFHYNKGIFFALGKIVFML